MIKKQKFGVEIEMTGITRIQAAKEMEVILEGRISNVSNNVYHTITVTDGKNREWKVMRDSSISTRGGGDEYSVELVTPPLQYEDIELLQQVVRALKEKGAITNSSCGIHYPKLEIMQSNMKEMR